MQVLYGCGAVTNLTDRHALAYSYLPTCVQNVADGIDDLFNYFLLIDHTQTFVCRRQSWEIHHSLLQPLLYGTNAADQSVNKPTHSITPDRIRHITSPLHCWAPSKGHPDLTNVTIDMSTQQQQ